MTSRPNIQRITLTALLAALIYVLTRYLQIPIPATQGYVHLGDAGITFAAFAFGPWVALLSGGLGTALADLGSGYAQWALFSLVVHGAQGGAMGWLTRKKITAPSAILSIIAGVVIVVGGYFLAGILLVGVAKAVTEILPNALQAVSGGIIGAPLYFAVLRAYPLLARYKTQE
ncbi:MAG TPA: ECF transporter S component [Anaerolineae bacterium]|nr:ECF transporter S component [Anaerolineae bacterium]